MELKGLSMLKDNRTNCYSIMFEMTVEDYLALISAVYTDKGGIKGQREPLKSSSAMRIRKQMVKDIKAKTILPPMVLGLITESEDFDKLPEMQIEAIKMIIENAKQGSLTIIDGMQRTTALNEAIEAGSDNDMIVRVEFWIAKRINSLIYRMLVLNTGQVPWNLRRQIETVFDTMIEEIKTAVPEMEIYKVDDGNRRSQGGQYHANDLVELYLAFGGRKEKVDTKERLADEFTRLDFIEATEKVNFSDVFYKSLDKLTKLDLAISKYTSNNTEIRFSNGKDLFKSQPGRVGFITALAKKIYGRPGYDKAQDQIEIINNELMEDLDALIERLNNMTNEQLGGFVSFEMLSEKLSVRSSRVGDFEREYFTKSFETLLEEGSEIPTMEICWSAY